MKKLAIWTVVSALAMIALPWLFRALIQGDLALAALFFLFYVLNPIYSAVVGAFAGRAVKTLWYLILLPPLFFLAGIGLLFTLSERAFFTYAVLYLALGTASMLISAAIGKRRWQAGG